ncbi:hypothetical protein QR680_005971 [Steinernema hermaphroditum]|uniref:Major facilitator superfamily (MFS) profile domain-containing protein n=1 Tax=Steinernema hermaphroditum TaxID=289476 RepID=A0AA39LVS1_9BILA|nr:hypothetical protein QR680_005971 [Steinernema hermaphroditum]
MQSSSVSQSFRGNDERKNDPKDPYTHLDADKLLAAFGKCGRFQVTGYVLLQMLNVLYAGSMFVMPFIQNVPIVSCDLSNLTKPNYALPEEPQGGECYLYDRNDSSNYFTCEDKGTGTNIVLNDTSPVSSMLVYYNKQYACSSALWKEAGLSVFTVGALVTVPFMAFAADRIGRRPVLLWCIYLSVVFNMAAPFLSVGNYYLFLVFRFIIGATSDSYLTIASILSCEVIAGDGRNWMGLIFTVAWVLGYLYVGVISKFISNWQHFYLAGVVPGLLTIGLYWVIPESPHWLIAHGKIDGIKRYILQAERFNNTKIDLHQCQATKEKLTNSNRERRRSIWRVLKNKTILAMLLINGFITLVHQMYYFALTLTSSKLSSEPFIGYVLSGLVEIPAGIVTLPLLHFFGRRTLTVTSLIFQGAFVAVCPYVKADNLEWVKITFNLLGKFSNGITSITHPLLISEVMPTTVRTLLFSIINIPQSLGILFAPYVKYLRFFDYEQMPILILCALSICAGLLALMLPETKGRPMPEDLIHIDPGPVLWKIRPSPKTTQSRKASRNQGSHNDPLMK